MDDGTHVDKSLIALGEDINDKLHVKPEVTCGRGCDRLDVMIFIPIKQILDSSYDLEETIGARSTCLIYDHDQGDIESLTRSNLDAAPGKVIGDEQDLQFQNDAYDRLWQLFHAEHWKVVNGFSVPCDPEQHVSPKQGSRYLSVLSILSHNFVPAIHLSQGCNWLGCEYPTHANFYVQVLPHYDKWHCN